MSYPQTLSNRKILSSADFTQKEIDSLLNKASFLAEGQRQEVIFTFEDVEIVFSTTAFVAVLKRLLPALRREKGKPRFDVTYDDLRVLPEFISVRNSSDESFHVVRHRMASSTIIFAPNSFIVPDLMNGIVVLLGEKHSGKTTFVQTELDIDFIIRTGEPLEAIDADPRIIPSNGLVDTLRLMLLLGFLEYRVAVDSLRELVYSVKGAASAGGIIPMVYTLMTNLNNLLASIGGVVLATMNPMVANQEALGQLQENMASSVAGLMVIDNGSIVWSEFRTLKGREVNTFRAGTYDVADRPPEIDSAIASVARAAAFRPSEYDANSYDSLSMSFVTGLNGDDPLSTDVPSSDHDAT